MAARAQALAERAEARLGGRVERFEARHDAKASRAVTLATRQSDRRTNHQVLGAVLLAVGGNWLLAELDLFPFGWPGLLAVGLMTLGLALIGTAKAGRTKPMVAIGVLMTVLLAMSSGVNGAVGPGFGDVHYAPTSAAQLQDLYQRKLGDLTLDLRSIELDSGLHRTTASVGLGDIDVMVSGDVAVRVVAENALGDIDLPGPTRVEGGSETVTYQSSGYETASTKLEVLLRTSIGDITVERR